MKGEEEACHVPNATTYPSRSILNVETLVVRRMKWPVCCEEADYDTLLTHNPGGACVFQSRPSAGVAALVATKGDSIGHCVHQRLEISDFS